MALLCIEDTQLEQNISAIAGQHVARAKTAELCWSYVPALKVARRDQAGYKTLRTEDNDRQSRSSKIETTFTLSPYQWICTSEVDVYKPGFQEVVSIK